MSWNGNCSKIRRRSESVRLSDGTELRKGGRVRLRPRRGGDVMDLALDGKIAVIESIEQDYEGSVHVGVVLDRRSRLRHRPHAAARPSLLFPPRRA